MNSMYKQTRMYQGCKNPEVSQRVYPWQVTGTQRERIVFQPSCFRGDVKLGGGNSNIFYFQPYLGKIPILTNIFQLGWNHQLVNFGRVLVHGSQEILLRRPQVSSLVSPWFTPLKPENQPLQKEIPFGNHHFQVPCWTSGVYFFVVFDGFFFFPRPQNIGHDVFFLLVGGGIQRNWEPRRFQSKKITRWALTSYKWVISPINGQK